MICNAQPQVTYNTYPRDVTAPGPYQRPGVAPSQTAAAPTPPKVDIPPPPKQPPVGEHEKAR
jgi:hypothetical protein